MTDVATLLARYVDEMNAGRRPQAREYLEQAESDADRRELAAAFESVIRFGPEDAFHPRAGSGEFVSEDDRRLAASIAEVATSEAADFPQALRRARDERGISFDELVDATVAEAGAPLDDQTRSVARRWLGGLESGSRNVFHTSRAALRAIAAALGTKMEDIVPREWEAHAGPAQIAFRADVDNQMFLAQIDAAADHLADALVGAPRDADELERWFLRE